MRKANEMSVADDRMVNDNYRRKLLLLLFIAAGVLAARLGLHEPFLMPGVIAGLVTIGLVSDLGRRLWSPSAGIWSGIALLALVQFPLLNAFEPPWYLLLIAVLWFPAIALLPWLVPAVWRDLRNGNAVTLLLGAWILFVPLFLSVGMGQHSLAVFAAAPALALLIGQHAPTLVARVSAQRVLVVFPILVGLLLITVAMYALMNPHTVARWLGNVPTILRSSFALLGIGFTMLISITICRRRWFLQGLASSMLVLWLGLSLFLLPALQHTRPGTIITEVTVAQAGSTVTTRSNALQESPAERNY